MTESYLTTDIIVIIVLVVVLGMFIYLQFYSDDSQSDLLVLIGVFAFFIHFYWTKIGVAEIWNTAKWSSMRSSFYQTLRRFSRASSSKNGSERPFSPASVFSDDIDGSALPAPLRNKKSNPSNPPPPPPSRQQVQVTSRGSATSNNGRRNSSNQIQPVSTITYNNSVRANYGTKIGQPLESTTIHNIHENDYNPPTHTESHRF